MKKKWIVLVFLACFLTSESTASANVPVQGKVILPAADVRESASPRAKRIGTLPKYTKLFVYQTFPGGWSEIDFQSRRAYVASSALRTTKQTKVVLFGDSNTAGSNWDKNPDYAASDKWASKLSRSFHVVQAGISGNTTVQGKKRFQEDVLDQNPHVVTIMFGTNDGHIEDDGTPRVSHQAFEENMRYFVQTLKNRDIQVVLMTTPPVIQGAYYRRNSEELYRSRGGVRLWLDSYNQIVRKIARQEEVTLIDHYQSIVFQAGGATDSLLSRLQIIDSSGNHLAPAGADLVYRAVADTLGQ